jgi:hypothetical protein
MGTKVAKLGVKREKDYLYFVDKGAVYKVMRKKPNEPPSKREKVADAGISMEKGFMYYVDSDGDVCHAKLSVGGQKRKSTKAAKKAVKKSAGKKKAAKKGGKKAAKKGGKKGKRK